MILDIIKKFNWVDLLVIFLVIRIVYIATKNGFPVELFKLLGTIAAIFVSLHYYAMLADLIASRFLANLVPHRFPLEFLDFLCFLILAVITYLVFLFLRSMFFQLVRIEAVSRLNKWGGFILGTVRAVFLSSLIVFGLAASSVTYFKNSVSSSYYGVRLFGVCTKTYTSIWEGFLSKFTNKEHFNKTIQEVEGSLR